MFSSKKLTEEQISDIKEWASQGAQLPEIQKRIREEMNFPLTFMDTRFLILDLKIELVTEEVPEKPTSSEDVFEVTPVGKTSVTMDSVALPGAMLSGQVTFSDGESGIWALDETGRPSLDLKNLNYQPSREDILEFQQQLRALVEKSGL